MVLSSGAESSSVAASKRLAESIALAPALDAGDAILGEHRAPVMELEAGPQHDLPQFAVVLGGRALGHLRGGAVAVVLAIERVEHQEGVIARHRRRRPDRVEHGKIRLGREFHDALARGEHERRRGKRRRGKRCRGGSFQEISSAQFILPARRFDRSSGAREMAPVEGEPDDLISEEGKTQAESKAGSPDQVR